APRRTLSGSAQTCWRIRAASFADQMMRFEPPLSRLVKTSARMPRIGSAIRPCPFNLGAGGDAIGNQALCSPASLVVHVAKPQQLGAIARQKSRAASLCDLFA